MHDIRCSFRALRKSPGFSIAAILTLAMGIGANAVVFSVMNGLILRPLSVPRAESLVMLERGRAKDGQQSYPDYVDLRDRNRSFDGLAASNITLAGLDTGDTPSRAWTEEVSGNYFDALGLQPYLGRFFHASDEHGPNSAPYIVLTYEYWHTRFQDDRSVVGRTVQINKHPFTIIGVASPGFHGTVLFFSPGLFLPLVNNEQISGSDFTKERGNHALFQVVGRLKPGITREQATADLNSIGRDLEHSYPKDDGNMTFTLANPSLYGDFLGPPVQAFMAALMLLSGLILLAACANLGSLFAARAADRSRDVALRLALGANRNRVLRPLLVEAGSIALIGGVAGLLGSIALLRALSAWQPFSRYPIHVPVNPDANVYGIAVALALVSGILFSIVPARQVLRVDPYQIIKSGSSAVGRRLTLRDLLLAAQIAICAVLVTSSLVAVRGLAHSLHSGFGFDVENTLLVDTDLTMAGYRGEQIPAMQKQMADAVKTIPGVEAVGLADAVPLSDGGSDSNVFADTASDLRPANVLVDALIFNVSPEYLHAAGTTLLSGRTFTAHEDKNTPPVAVVNRQFARKVFGSEANAVGRYYKFASGKRIQVVGIVEDGKYTSLTESPQSVMFRPILQSPSSSTWLVVRSERDPQSLAASIRGSIRQLDPGLPIFIQTRFKAMDILLFPARMATISLGVLGVMGAMLAITGIFGMAAYSVSRRLKELGIRIAIGAKPEQVLQAALGRAFKLLALGSAVGLVLGILASKVLAAIVYQATPRDPLVLVGVVMAMLVMGLVATWIPAQRALSLSPLRLLREE
ncbi:MAG TPA: ABC transporter permease [Bryobacteraceae bacterium]|nr:ABC transporter permease [Bryobacteraceae bacterium]